jgi:hypothetical protein
MSDKFERKVISSLAKLIANESVLNRWRIGGRVLSIFGWALLFYSAFNCLGQPFVHRGFVVVAMLGGACAVLGLWFSSFTLQWPFVAQFLDRQAIVSRNNGL